MDLLSNTSKLGHFNMQKGIRKLSQLFRMIRRNIDFAWSAYWPLQNIVCGMKYVVSVDVVCVIDSVGGKVYFMGPCTHDPT